MPAGGFDRARAEQLRAWSAGAGIAAGLVAGGLIGWAIDAAAGTGPWWMLGLGIAGLVSGVYKFVREALAMNREASARWRASHAGSDRSGPDSGGVSDGGGAGENPLGSRSPDG